MAVATVAAFVEVIQKLQLLTADQRNQLPALPKQFPDTKAFAQELVRRGWLTTFQARQIGAGKAASLVLDQYVLLDLLGEGGMGAVYKAKQTRMDRLVALKVIRKEALASATSVERFQREARSCAKLSHPNVIAVFDSNTVNGTPFLVMEFIQGTDLAKLVDKQGPLPVAQACDYIRQAAVGLQHAHEQGLVHRDIKPHNLMLTKQGVVKVMDLGLARTVYAAEQTAASKGLTGTGAIMGTADYLAPEQAQDAKRVDIRADIYSLGCSLYHLLAGEPPFAGGTLANKIAAHMFTPPPPIAERRPDVRPELAVVLERMLAKKPAERFQTPAYIAEALAPFAMADTHAPELHKVPATLQDLMGGGVARPVVSRSSPSAVSKKAQFVEWALRQANEGNKDVAISALMNALLFSDAPAIAKSFAGLKVRDIGGPTQVQNLVKAPFMQDGIMKWGGIVETLSKSVVSTQEWDEAEAAMLMDRGMFASINCYSVDAGGFLVIVFSEPAALGMDEIKAKYGAPSRVHAFGVMSFAYFGRLMFMTSGPATRPFACRWIADRDHAAAGSLRPATISFPRQSQEIPQASPALKRLGERALAQYKAGNLAHAEFLLMNCLTFAPLARQEEIGRALQDALQKRSQNSPIDTNPEETFRILALGPDGIDMEPARLLANASVTKDEIEATMLSDPEIVAEAGGAFKSVQQSHLATSTRFVKLSLPLIRKRYGVPTHVETSPGGIYYVFYGRTMFMKRPEVAAPIFLRWLSKSNGSNISARPS